MCVIFLWFPPPVILFSRQHVEHADNTFFLKKDFCCWTNSMWKRDRERRVIFVFVLHSFSSLCTSRSWGFRMSLTGGRQTLDLVYTQTFLKTFVSDRKFCKKTNQQEWSQDDWSSRHNERAVGGVFAASSRVFFFLFFLRFCGCRCVCVCFFVYVHYSGPSNYPNIQLCHYPARLLISLSLLNKNPWLIVYTLLYSR